MDMDEAREPHAETSPTVVGSVSGRSFERFSYGVSPAALVANMRDGPDANLLAEGWPLVTQQHVGSIYPRCSRTARKILAVPLPGAQIGSLPASASFTQ